MYLDEYLEALKNEISIDESFYSMWEERPDSFGFLPRPMVWIGANKNRKALLNFLGRLLKSLWLGGGGILFFLFKFLKFLFLVSLASKKLNIVRGYSEYAIAFSARALDIIVPPITSHRPTIWITFPWCKPKRIVGDVYCVTTILSVVDVFKVLVLAIRSVYGVNRLGYREWVLQTYSAFEWFVARLAIRKLGGGSIIIAAHFDRWAVLAGFAAEQFKRLDLHQMKKSTTLTLVQHGILRSASEGGSSKLAFRIPSQIRSVDCLYVYDQESADIFINEVVQAEEKPPKVIIRPPQIKLVKLDEDKPRILFVGHSLCERFHLNLYLALKRCDVSAVFYYKPHPLIPCSDAIRYAGWKVIDGRTEFPAADLLISYPSTLVTEYRICGVSSIVHGLNADENEVETVVRDVVKALVLVKH